MHACRAPDPATSAIIQTVSGQTPGVPPGAKTVRVPGSQEAVAPLHYDPVGPWGRSRSACGASQKVRRMPSRRACLAGSSHLSPHRHQLQRWPGRGHLALQEKSPWPLMPAAAAAGVTPGPGRGPSDFERMQRRHRGGAATSALLHGLAATPAWRQPAIRLPGQTARAFNKRIEVRSAWQALPATASPAAPGFQRFTCEICSGCNMPYVSDQHRVSP